MKQKTLTQKFGQVLRLARKRANLSQEKLAELANIDRTYVSMIERGKRHLTIEVANRLAQALGIQLNELIKNAESEEI